MSVELQLVKSAALPYLVSVPSSAGPHPLLCFLHGYDEAAPMPIRKALTLHGPLRGGNPPRVQDHFIVVAPQLPHAGDLWHLHSDAVLEIATQAQETFGADPARMYLTGFSFGGNGVFDLAVAQPNFWAALWAVDPTRVPRSDPGRPVWVSIGEVTRYAARAFIRALALQLADGDTGDRVYTDEGLGHVGTATSAYRDSRVYDWLLARSN